MQEFTHEQFSPGGNANTYVAEASELGLAPGKWPIDFYFTTPNGIRHIAAFNRSVTSGSGELLAKVYMAPGLEIQIIND